ncbi:MAG TPA: FAD/NAD(P)-binding protein, partial [Dyadobacter sp.]|nr:FAD/NAD(P)-binding protein [Dyadobacter sp.]
TIIEENKEVGKGLAFGTKQPGHILNTQANLMGIHVDEPEHFSDWLIENEHQVEAEVVDNKGRHEAFATRRLYGDYLKSQFECYLKLSKKEGMDVSVIHAQAENISKLKSGFKINLANGESHKTDFVLLAPGTPIANNYAELEKHDTYFSSPWPSSPLLKKIPKDAQVGILGSSLSAIDALMTLEDNGYTGKITCYSLDGLLPRVQADDQPMPERKYITLRNLHEIQRTKLRRPTVKDMLRLFIKEAEALEGKKIDWKATARTDKDAATLLKEDIALAKNGGDALTNIPYSLRYDSTQMWKWLEESEKLKFKKWVGGLWGINRHCMPLVNAQRIAALFKKGRLSIVADLTSVEFDDQSKSFELTFGKNQLANEKYLINATGPAAAVKMMKSELIQNLAKDGLIEADPVGGIRINPDTMQVTLDGDSTQGLYAVGHITNGTLLDVNAVWFNVKMIGTLCRHLTREIIGQPA